MTDTRDPRPIPSTLAATLAMLKIDLKLAGRDRSVLFFNYFFPLIFFFIFAETLNADQGGTISYVATMVLVLGVLGNGLFGAGIRAAQERDANILRRFKVAPITPVPILLASMVTGWVIYIPTVLIVLSLSHFIYGMPWPAHVFSLAVILSLGVLALRAIGLIIASVANSMQESNLLIQTLYMPMLFLSGATFPVATLPEWGQIAAQFMPAAYLVTALQGVFFRGETLVENGAALLALTLTAVLGIFISTRLFRWDKDEKIKPAGKLWVAAVLTPFLFVGGYQAYSRQEIQRNKTLWRSLQRSRTMLVRDARIFAGDGRVIENGAVLIKGGRIEQVYVSDVPTAASLNATEIEAAGKTLMPGLIDVHVHVGGIATLVPPASLEAHEAMMRRALSASLYAGVTAVQSVGDPLATVLALRAQIANGERLGAELSTCGPVFTAEGGHGTQILDQIPQAGRAEAARQVVRTPPSPDEARRQVRELSEAGVDCIKAMLESGQSDRLLPRLDVSVLKAIVDEAGRHGLPVFAHTSDERDVREALEAGVAGIEHGSVREVLPDEVFATMAAAGVTYDPTLVVLEAANQVASGEPDVLARSLVLQVLPREVLASIRRAVASRKDEVRSEPLREAQETATENLRRAWQAGVPLVAGSDAGNPLVFQGPAIHRELQLWVDAGLPPTVALTAATTNAARQLGKSNRLGRIVAGADASLLLVDGDPTRDVASTERISTVFFKGERIVRAELFDDYETDEQ